MTTTKLIASSGGDYATMTLAEAGLAAFDAGANMTDPWVFLVANEIIADNNCIWSGAYGGLSSTNTITIKPNFAGSGVGTNADCSFAGNHDYASEALDYDANAGKGAGFNLSGTNFEGVALNAHMVLQGLQFRSGTTYQGRISTRGTVGNIRVLANIFRVDSGNTKTFHITNTGSGNLFANNCFIGGSADDGLTTLENTFGSNPTYFVANTWVLGKSFAAGNRVISKRVYCPANEWYQNAVYHHTPASGHPFLNESAIADVTGDYNVQTPVNVGTDAASRALPGANTSLVGVTANDITDGIATSGSDTVDCRPKAGGLLIAFIPSASRFTGSGVTANAADTDIRGQTRVGVNNDCGCFQVTAAASDTLMGQAHF